MGLHAHLELWCPLSSGVSCHAPGRPLRGSSLTAAWLWNESYHPQVRELEKQLGQTQSRSGTASDELSVCPDPRKMSAQEKNLLRIRNLEREKQEGWEVMHAGEVSWAWGLETMTPCRRPRRGGHL